MIWVQYEPNGNVALLSHIGNYVPMVQHDLETSYESKVPQLLL